MSAESPLCTAAIPSSQGQWFQSAGGHGQPRMDAGPICAGLVGGCAGALSSGLHRPSSAGQCGELRSWQIPPRPTLQPLSSGTSCISGRDWGRRTPCLSPESIADLGDVVGLVPDHSNKAGIAIKRITHFFLIFRYVWKLGLHCSLLSVYGKLIRWLGLLWDHRSKCQQ